MGLYLLFLVGCVAGYLWALCEVTLVRFLARRAGRIGDAARRAEAGWMSW